MQCGHHRQKSFCLNCEKINLDVLRKKNPQSVALHIEFAGENRKLHEWYKFL